MKELRSVNNHRLKKSKNKYMCKCKYQIFLVIDPVLLNSWAMNNEFTCRNKINVSLQISLWEGGTEIVHCHRETMHTEFSWLHTNDWAQEYTIKKVKVECNGCCLLMLIPTSPLSFILLLHCHLSLSLKYVPGSVDLECI